MKKNNIKISTNKSFGIVFFIFFLIIAIFPLLEDKNIRVWSLSISIIFFTIVTPTSLIMKLFGKNLLNLKKSNKSTYWIKRSDIKSKMKNQF